MANWWEAAGGGGGDKSAGGWGEQAAGGGGGAWGAPAAAETPADDPWATAAKADDGWGGGGGGGGDDAWAAPAPTGRDYWDAQEWLKSMTVTHKEEWEWQQDEAKLFDCAGRASAGINFAKYENVPVDLCGDKANSIPVCKTFQEILDTFAAFVPPELVQNLQRCGYTTPTPVQKFAIPAGLVGRDVMCCAQTGSGKTAAFLVPLIGRMMKEHPHPVGSLTAPFEGECRPISLVITPTRELCIQIYEESLKLCHRTPHKPWRLYGGEKPKVQLEEMAKGADMIVACPGRLKDFLSREVIKLDTCQFLVLDEADRMLDMGFEGDIEEIVTHMPPRENRQTMMFSATFPEKCQKLAMTYLFEYIWIAVGVVGGATESVEQVLEQVDPSKKFEKLVEVMDAFYATRQKTDRMLVFVNAKDTARWLDQQLYDKNMDSGALHGDLEQADRENNLRKFRFGEIDILIATDVAARGLDVEGVSLVVNYDFPKEADTYIHRIGRTGRIGNEGKAISFLSTENGASLENVSLLKELAHIMVNSGKTPPAWFDPLVEATEANGGAGGWSWGGQDVRPGQESVRNTGGGDAWGNWNKEENKEAGDGDDAWGKNSAWDDKGANNSW